jgi:hypothetical protein
MPISPFKDRFGKALQLTGSFNSGSIPPSVGVSSSLQYINDTVKGMLTAKIDRFRQGVSITNKSYVRRDSNSTITSIRKTAIISGLPTITSHGYSGETTEEIHAVEIRDFGQPKLFKDNEPFEEMATMSRPFTKIVSNVTSAYGGPISFIEDSGLQQYPVILANVSMKDPSQMDGVIEPLSIREVISNTSQETPFVAHRVRASIMDGNVETIYGSDRILQQIPITGSLQIDPFIDAADVLMSIISGSDSSLTTFNLFAPGFISDIQRKSNPYVDSRKKYIKTLIGSGSQEFTLGTGSLRERGLTDYMQKSAGSGFTYGNNELGTDSIAFGGFKK